MKTLQDVCESLDSSIEMLSNIQHQTMNPESIVLAHALLTTLELLSDCIYLQVQNKQEIRQLDAAVAQIINYLNK